jgi:hypothetical protein
LMEMIILFFHRVANRKTYPDKLGFFIQRLS